MGLGCNHDELQLYNDCVTYMYMQGCRMPVRPARSACQAGHLAWPGRPDRDLTGRQVGIHPLIIIIINSFCDVYSYRRCGNLMSSSGL